MSLVMAVVVLIVALCLAGPNGGLAVEVPSPSPGGIAGNSPSLQLPENPQNLHDEGQVRGALQYCEEMLRDHPKNHEVLINAAYLSYRLGWLFADKDERKDLYFKFFDYATRARERAPQDYRSSLLLAVAKAKVVGYLSQSDQVRIARELAEEAESLVQRQVNDPDSIYLLSWLNFKVGSLPALHRMVAAAFFGGLPQGLSVEKAFALLHKAIQYRPDYVVYQYDMGFFYLRTGARDEARRQFEMVLARLPQTAEDLLYQRRATARLREMAKEG